jgi:DNA-binding transcriptional ArsR family regulator
MVKYKTSTSAKSKGLVLSLEVLGEAALTLKAINHPVRQNILQIIHKNKEISVSKIYAILNLEQSLTSTHLAVLRKYGIVKTKREGQSIFYSVNYTQLAQIEKGAKQIISG